MKPDLMKDNQHQSRRKILNKGSDLTSIIFYAKPLNQVFYNICRQNEATISKKNYRNSFL